MRTKDEAKLRALFASTLELVAHTGLSGLTMSAVAKGAGLATGTTYRYFRGKDQLLSALYRDIKKNFSQEVFEHIPHSNSLKSNLRAMWDNYLDFLILRRKESIFLQQFNHSPYINEKENLNLALEVMDPLLALFRDGIEKEILRTDEEELLFPLFAAFLEQCAIKIIASPKQIKSDISKAGFNMYWNAIRA
ncbi:TetR/AcrR family transcriptional regulator [Sphingobacterium sp.]|uniref:TetR/AcrR family transcriptional regulator n=1 Tax=Sphingobacterium sp. TaxID=341027 RepID=UPI002FDB3C0A